MEGHTGKFDGSSLGGAYRGGQCLCDLRHGVTMLRQRPVSTTSSA